MSRQTLDAEIDLRVLLLFAIFGGIILYACS